MLRAADMRGEGKSLREIARALGCSHQTVANDLGRLAAEARVSKLPVKKKPPRGGILTRRFDGASDVIPLRRTS